MSQFRKKPVIVEAPLIVEAMQFLPDSLRWADGVTREPGEGKPYFVTTIHGERATVVSGDWIIREPDGVHFRPCKPDIFEAAYEPVQEDLTPHCGVCGGTLVSIRGRHPGDDRRSVCPTCIADRLDTINVMSNRDYGLAFSAEPAIPFVALKEEA